jgi:hypothetical protein
MNRMIWLRDCSDVPTPPHSTCSPAEMESARTVQAGRGLRFDNLTGITYRQGRWIARYSNPSDHTPYDSVADILADHFMPHIANSASRVSRGFEP